MISHTHTHNEPPAELKFIVTLTRVETRPLWLGEQTCFTCAQILASKLSTSPAPPAANLAASGAGVISVLPSASETAHQV